MEEYTVNFLADVDVTIKAESPEEARKKAEKMFGEYHDKQFDMHICQRLSSLQRRTERRCRMEGPQKFIDWLLEMGYLEQDDIPTDKKEIIADIRKVRTVAPKFLQHDDVYVQLRRKRAMTMTWNEIYEAPDGAALRR